MSNTNTEVLTTAYEKLQAEIARAEDIIKRGDFATKTDIATQSARIDSFTRLAEGSTTGDAELIDARSVNGTTYTNLGGAIRAISSGEAISSISYDKIKYTYCEFLEEDTVTIDFSTKKITVLQKNIKRGKNVSLLPLSTINIPDDITGIYTLYYDFSNKTVGFDSFWNLSGNIVLLCNIYNNRVSTPNMYGIKVIKSNGYSKAFNVPEKSITQDLLRTPTAYLINKNLEIDFKNLKLNIKNTLYLTIDYSMYSVNSGTIDISNYNNDSVNAIVYNNSSKKIQFLNNITLDTNHYLIAYIYKKNIYGVNEKAITVINTEGIIEDKYETILGFTDDIIYNQDTQKVIFPNIYIIRNGFAWKLIKPSDYSLDSFSFSTNSNTEVWTYYIDLNLLDSSEIPIKIIKASKHPNLNMDTCIILGNSTLGKFNSKYPFKIYTNFENDFKLILPDTFYMVKGKELPFYKSEMFPNYDELNNNKVAMLDKTLDIYPKFTYIDEVSYLSITKTHTRRISAIFKQNYDKSLFKDVTFKCIDPYTVSKKDIKMVNIGDSLTDFGLSTYTKNLAGEYNCNIKILGTRANSEGRAGWTVENYIGKNNIETGLPIVPMTILSDKKRENPFLKLATAADKKKYPDYCFRNTGSNNEKSYSTDNDKTGNFYIFDYSYYKTLINDTPDVLTIALGTDDLWNLNTDFTYALNGLTFMINRILEVDANANIAVIPQPASGSNVNGNKHWRLNYTRWIEAVYQKVKAINKDNVNLLGVWIHMNKDFIFGYSSENIQENSMGIKEGIRQEYVRFNSSGYWEYAHALLGWICNKMFI